MIDKPILCPWCNNTIDNPYEELHEESGISVSPHVVSCFCKWGQKVIGFSVGFNMDCQAESFTIQKVLSDSSFIAIRIEIAPPRCTVLLCGERVNNSKVLALEENSNKPHLSVVDAKYKLLKYEKLLVFI